MLGDTIAAALAKAGITDERVSQWLGRPCGCRERQEKLNALGNWAKRVVAGRLTGAREFLERITGV